MENLLFTYSWAQLLKRLVHWFPLQTWELQSCFCRQGRSVDIIWWWYQSFFSLLIYGNQICCTCWHGQEITIQVCFLSPMEDCASAYSLVSANLADHWLTHLFMGKKNGKPDFFNWIEIVKLALHFPLRKWGWGWCFRPNWKEGRLMVGNKRK